MTPGQEEWSEGSARRVAEQAVATRDLGVATHDLELVRLGTNGVFYAGETVVRVSPPDESRELVGQQLLFATWLIEQGFPTSTPLLDQPHLIDGSLVTIWSRIYGEPGRCADRLLFGQLVREFHELTNSYAGPLAAWEPLGRLGKRLDVIQINDALRAWSQNL